MRTYKSEIEIKSNHDDFTLFIYEEQNHTLCTIDEMDALQHGESPYQLMESRGYGYYFNKDNYRIKPISGVVSDSQGKQRNRGRITPGIFAGTLQLEIIEVLSPEETIQVVDLEIIAVKLDFSNDTTEIDQNYRNNYKTMLVDIADKCTELLMQINSPVNQNFEPDFEHENETIYQRFVFVKSLVASDDFNDAVNRILYAPSTKWCEEQELFDIRRTRRFNNSSIKQIISGTNRIEYELNEEIHSVPSKILNIRKVETVDTPENRFVKFALQRFVKFCENCEIRFRELNYFKAESEAKIVVNTLQIYLEAPFFKKISTPTTLFLNSPVLQRKNGYREVLNAWMLFDLAAKLIWPGGEKVYKAGKRDIAVLYEYWLFFKLHDLFLDNFDTLKITHGNSTTDLGAGKIEIKHLIEATNDGLGLKLKSGVETSLIGKTKNENRELTVRFSYNRTFAGGVKYNEKDQKWIASQGSWTKSLRPDYTFSFWPSALSEEDAEKEDIIVHIHFDAKYKVKHFQIDPKIISTTNDEGETVDTIEKEKEEERKGIYKNADLLKMHAYKDAIRRTGGSYVLYPGEGSVSYTNNEYHGFHELIPGLGAFAVRPSAENNGIAELSAFMTKVINHLQNRASQRENTASKIYDIHKSKKKDEDVLYEQLPEYLDADKKQKLIPDETFVLVGYYKSKQHLEWIKDKKKYNGRIGDANGSMDLTPEFIGAQYLILHNINIPDSIIFKINQSKKNKPSVISSSDKIFEEYPNASKPFYLVFNLLEKEVDFLNGNYNVKLLNGFSEERKAYPFTCKLSELLRNRI